MGGEVSGLMMPPAAAAGTTGLECGAWGGEPAAYLNDASSRSEGEAASMHAERSKGTLCGGQGASCYSCADAVTQKHPKAGLGGFRALAEKVLQSNTPLKTSRVLEALC